LAEIEKKCYEAMDDDFNTPILISHLFELVKLVNAAADNKAAFSPEDLELAKKLYASFVEDVLGLQDSVACAAQEGEDPLQGVMDIVLEIRAKAKADKDWATSDLIRDRLKAAGISVMDGKDGATWSRI
ncbi:MAG: cysteine--tRNA ligase, partial [Bacteroidales bacterium]|nr:cysteine--tRNA ligase [Bacteroidales bacterium]